MTPDALILLANLGRPRRPARHPTPRSEPVLPDSATAGEQLAPLVSLPVDEADLPALRRVQQIAEESAESLLAGRTPDCEAMTALARGSTAHVELIAGDVGLRQEVTWTDSSNSSGLARRLIAELAALDPHRLRRCARDACDLIFYDTTRSRTRRWHAEDPCGWRERQQNRRTHQ
ncbi:CGNR zinc finger domain-containing protein [Streptomyces sp. NPDC047061]|uniref:CGNR zinc finger domain-containing protein n=1 Tax=Streptomyces sp. NPDC047061 TaxID=3154605 RepID=UPI003407D096